MLCCYNFTPNPVEGFVVGLPAEGKLVEVLNSDDGRFGGTGVSNSKPIEVVDEPFEDQPCSASVDLPPLSAVYFEYKKTKKRKSKIRLKTDNKPRKKAHKDIEEDA